MNTDMLDSLVTVHFDSMDSSDFTRLQIEERIEQYRDAGRKVYNFSTLDQPEPSSGIVQIPCFGNSDSHYGLDQQIGLFLPDLKKNQGSSFSQPLEIVGVAYFICVREISEKLRALGIPTTINYDYTDIVPTLHLTSKIGVALESDDGAEQQVSPEMLAKYDASLS